MPTQTATASPLSDLIPVLVALAPVVPGLVVQIVALFHSTSGNPTVEDWQKLALKVSSTPFDAPPGVANG